MSIKKKIILLLLVFVLLLSVLACEEVNEITKVIQTDKYFFPIPDDDNDDDDNADDDDDSGHSVEWEWQEVEGTICRDGSESGMGLRPSIHGSKNLAIYVEATGICATKSTCEENLDFFEDWIFEEIINETGYGGLFNPDNELNPIWDWNYLYIPPCTGDMHSGSNLNGKVPFLTGVQRFTGHLNMKVYVERIKEEFDFTPERILLWGQCSGGTGLFPSYALFKEAFPDTPVTLLNDSGPLGFDDAAFAPCLQQKLRDLYLINPALPADCEECFGPGGDGLASIQTYLAEKYTDGNFGLLMPLQDEAIREAWGAGMDNCLGFLFGSMVPEEIFTNALLDLRDNHLLPTGRWSTLYMEGAFHTFGLADDWIFEDHEQNVLYQWVKDIIEGNVPASIYFNPYE